VGLVKVAIVGAGAIGGTVGAYLVRTGHDVTFIDRVEEHVEAIKRTGLHITGPIDDFTVQAPAYLVEDAPRPFEHVFLSVKANATRAAAQSLLPLLADDGYVLSLQNGLNEIVLSEVLGAQRVIGCFVNFGADYLGPGEIHYGGHGAVVVGELDGSTTPRLIELHEALRAFEPQAKLTGNIWGYLWSKLAVGAMITATAITDDGIADCYAMPEYRPLFAAIAREVLAVAEAAGVRPEPFDGFDPAAFSPAATPAATEASLDDMVAFNRRSAKTHSGVWRDLAVRLRPTEIPDQLGPVVTRAAELGLGTPLLTALLRLLAEVEAGSRERSRDNLAEMDRVRRAQVPG
jgi:2-dehydropantoate 2-reductase